MPHPMMSGSPFQRTVSPFFPEKSPKPKFQGSWSVSERNSFPYSKEEAEKAFQAHQARITKLPDAVNLEYHHVYQMADDHESHFVRVTGIGSDPITIDQQYKWIWHIIPWPESIQDLIHRAIEEVEKLTQKQSQ